MNVDFSLFLPEYVVAGLALLVMAVDLFLPEERKHWLAYLSIAGILGAIVSVFPVAGKAAVQYDGLFLIDHYAAFFKVFLLASGGFMVLASMEHVKKNLAHAGEFYGVLMFSILAMMAMVSAGELLTAYISLELFSFCLYILAGYNFNRPKSIEAGIKYILIGAFSSAMLLYGISLIYGATGTTVFTEIAAAISGGADSQIALTAGLVLVLVGFGFKVTAAPFHMWAPDVYEGAPTPVTGYLAVVSKAVSFALLLRLFATAFGPVVDDWRPIVAGLGAATVVIGNLVAMNQRNIKRMLAYSSIGNAGYLLMGLAAFSTLAANGMVFHLIGYSATNFAVFACVIAFENMTGKEMIEDYKGLSKRQPFLAFVMSMGMFSLGGLPIFAGFATKFYLFTAVAKADLLWLVIIATLGSLISLYYYLMVMKAMYLDEPSDATPLKLTLPIGTVVASLGFATLFFGVYPGPLITLIEQATRNLGL